MGYEVENKTNQLEKPFPLSIHSVLFEDAIIDTLRAREYFQGL